VCVPEMPDTEHPKIETWVPYLAKLVGRPDGDTYLIGHSMGTQTILRYAETLGKEDRIGGILLVAAFVTLKNIALLAADPDEARRVVGAWLATPIRWADVLQHTGNITTMLSDDDPYVPLGDSKTFGEKLHSKIVVEHGMGHMNQARVPEILDEFLSLVKNSEA